MGMEFLPNTDICTFNGMCYPFSLQQMVGCGKVPKNGVSVAGVSDCC